MIVCRIHYTLPDGTEDSIVIRAETDAELIAIAHAEVAKRNATNPWSEDLS